MRSKKLFVFLKNDLFTYKLEKCEDSKWYLIEIIPIEIEIFLYDLPKTNKNQKIISYTENKDNKKQKILLNSVNEWYEKIKQNNRINDSFKNLDEFVVFLSQINS